MIEWTEEDRKYADDIVNENIDGFNKLDNPVEMINYLLTKPTQWCCKRWEAMPMSKFEDILFSIKDAIKEGETK